MICRHFFSNDTKFSRVRDRDYLQFFPSILGAKKIDLMKVAFIGTVSIINTEKYELDTFSSNIVLQHQYIPFGIDAL